MLLLMWLSLKLRWLSGGVRKGGGGGGRMNRLSDKRARLVGRGRREGGMGGRGRVSMATGGWGGGAC